MIENLPNEVWMSHPQFDWIAASNFGRIKSLERDVYKKDGSFLRHLQEQLIEPYPNKNGYLRLRIYNTNLGIDDWTYAHRFVYECLNQVTIPDELEVNHIDCNRSNNQIENLELLDHQSNVDYSVSKSVGQFDLDGNLIKIWKSTMECGRNGFNSGAVAACCRNCYMREGNNRYKHFIWKYIE